jgi:hypothetical protein
MLSHEQHHAWQVCGTARHRGSIACLSVAAGCSGSAFLALAAVVTLQPQLVQFGFVNAGFPMVDHYNTQRSPHKKVFVFVGCHIQKTGPSNEVCWACRLPRGCVHSDLLDRRQWPVLGSAHGGSWQPLMCDALVVSACILSQDHVPMAWWNPSHPSEFCKFSGPCLDSCHPHYNRQLAECCVDLSSRTQVDCVALVTLCHRMPPG